MIHFTDKHLPLDAIDEPAAALRESIDSQALGELVDSMASDGLLQPIGARGPNAAGRYEVIWGHRRTLAARTLGWTEIAARVCPADTAPELARIAENFHRVDLNPREEARAIDALRASGRPLSEIARILRRSISWVETRVELTTWPSDLQEAVERRELTLASARLLSEIDHDDYRASLIAEAKRTGATAPTVSIWLAHYAADRDRIIHNHETVQQIVERRETFHVLFDCECCGDRKDTRESALLRICARCARTLADEKLDAERERQQELRG